MMRRSALGLALCLAITPMLSWADTSFGGQVIAVLDGDTVDVLTPEKKKIRVRLANIDAPEKSQAFGQKSRQALADIVFRKDVVVLDSGTDRYGRQIGRVMVGKVEANVEQVRDGFAWVYTQYNKDQQLPALEASARERKIGLWHDDAPTPPWLFRRAQK